MKANRKFIRENDDAVSPVIATILMVAITVVLGATVYVWVSGFGSSGKQAPSLSVSKVSTSGDNVVYQFNSISAANVPWSDLEVKVNGATIPRPTSGSATENLYGGDCATFLADATNVAAGDQFCYKGGSSPVGKTLTVAHKPTGSVLATVTI